MSDKKIGLPVRTEEDVDKKVQVKVVDATNPDTQQMEVDTDGNAHVEMHGNDPAGVDRVLKTSEEGSVDIDGVYDADPRDNPDAKRYDHLTYSQVLAEKLGVMDLTAVSMCMENDLPIVVFKMADAGNLAAVVCGQDVGTTVGNQ